MPLTRIKQTAIGADSITSPKLAHNLDFDGQFIRVPHGTTAERPGSPAAGYMRFNTTIGTLEQWNTATNSWQAIDSPPILSSLAYAGSLTGANPAGSETITLTGINFKAGATVTIGGTSATSVSIASSTSITFTTPAKTAGDYDVTVTNTNGLQATLSNGISYNGVPAFSTAAGNVGSVSEDVAMSTITIVAAEPDGGTLAYSVTSGALPTGVSLGSGNGQLTGTPNVNLASTTTFNFTVTATDDENQTNARAFNIIVLRPVYSTPLAKSLRFDSSQSTKLTRTPSSASNRRTFTFSFWVKRGKLGANQGMFGAESSGNRFVIGWGYSNNDSARFYSQSPAAEIYTTAAFRDTSAWQHMVWSVDTTQATAANRVKLYINGTQITSFTTATYPSQNADFSVNNNIAQYIGSWAADGSAYFDGYLSDVHFIDGQALTPTSFAEEYYGVWTPKAYSGSYGTNGYQLKFGTTSALGDDTSGNTNDWTSAGLVASDSMPDTPTNNFATYNPLILRRDVTSTLPEFTKGNLKASYANAGGNQTYSFGTISNTSGKWYYEVYMTATGSNTTVGIGSQRDIDANNSDNVIYRNTGAVSTTAGGSKNNDGASFATGDIIGIAYDLDNGTVKFYKNGTLTSTVTGMTTLGYNKQYLPYTRGTTSENNVVNFGQDSTFDANTTAAANADGNGIGNFKYAVPSGHLALCSKNLPESTVNTSSDDRPEDYFNTVLYTGSGSSATHTLGFKPNLVWGKKRGANAQNNWLIDDVSDINTWLSSDGNTAEGSEANGTVFTSTGFTTANNDLFVNNGGTYVAWGWKAGGTPTASNTNYGSAPMTANSVALNGSLQSSYTPSGSPTQYPTKMSINTKAGFSIVGWTGTNAVKTLPHGLSQTPELMILKGRDARVWSVHHKNHANGTYYQNIAGNHAQSADGSMFNNTFPNANVFTIGTYNYVNNVNYIGYFWHSVPGFSKIGAYIGTSSATAGAFVECGFKPAFVLIKCITNTGSWYLLDNKREPNNELKKYLISDSNAAEVTAGNFLDFTTTGFKLRTSGGEVNAAGQTYMFMAFAEDQHKYSEAR